MHIILETRQDCQYYSATFRSIHAARTLYMVDQSHQTFINKLHFGRYFPRFR